MQHRGVEIVQTRWSVPIARTRSNQPRTVQKVGYSVIGGKRPIDLEDCKASINALLAQLMQERGVPESEAVRLLNCTEVSLGPDFYPTIKCVTRKNKAKWESNAYLELGNSHRLRILTTKRSDGSLSTTASVCVWEDCKTYQFEKHIPDEDYFRTLIVEHPKRFTAQVVDAQMTEALKGFSTIYEEVVKMYGSRLKEAPDAALAQNPVQS